MIDTSSLLGPLGVGDYRRYADSSQNNPDYALLKITEKFASPENSVARAARDEMWRNYSELLNLVANSKFGNVLSLVHNFILEKSETARSEFTAPCSRLAAHLEEIEKFCPNFLLTPDGHSRFGNEVLSERNAKLLSFIVAPLHDRAKYLGSAPAQVVPDHEIMAAELVRRTFEGKTVFLAETETLLSLEDVNFIAGVIGDHENLEKELGRREWILSPDPVKRAKALFALADTLTAALVSKDDGHTWLVDPPQFRKRFTDLYFRHIDLKKGKIFRPEWGLHTIADLSFTLEYLGKLGVVSIRGETLQESIAQALTRAGLEAIDMALAANGERIKNGDSEKIQTFSAEQLERIMVVRDSLSSSS